MNEFENIQDVIPENPPSQNDPYTYYAGRPSTPAVPRYVPEHKK